MFLPGWDLDHASNARARKVRALAVTSPRRWPNAPDLALVAESGYPGFDMVVWSACWTGRQRMIDELKAAGVAEKRVGPVIQQGRRPVLDSERDARQAVWRARSASSAFSRLACHGDLLR